jgi:hypothetical protein
MLDFILRAMQSIGLYMGLLFLGSSLIIGGLKIYEHSTYVPTEATVVAVSTKCEMTFRTGRWSRTERTVDCAEVAGVKARTPEVDWTVNRVTFVEIAFQAESGETVRKTERLGKLERTSAAPGDKIPILRSRDRNNLVTGPVNASFLRIVGTAFIIGAVLWACRCGSGGCAIRRRRPRCRSTTTLRLRASSKRSHRRWRTATHGHRSRPQPAATSVGGRRPWTMCDARLPA